MKLFNKTGFVGLCCAYILGMAFIYLFDWNGIPTSKNYVDSLTIVGYSIISYFACYDETHGFLIDTTNEEVRK